jgi:hypothetical protein
MASIVLAGNTSGSITISSPSVSGTNTLTLPASTGTVLTTNGSGIASVNGVQFPATQSVSADANTLDDYEEGTFTVAVRGAVTAGTYTMTGQSCVYTKIGRLVSLAINISGFSTATGGSAYFQITGMPFPNGATGSRGVVSGNSLNFSAGTLFAIVAFGGSSTTLYLEEVKDNAAFADFDISGITTSSSNISITITYPTT